jgi:hypothetical protein
MPFHQPDTVRYFKFNSLTDSGIKHAILTRRGGVSPPPWHSLNVGATVGDDRVRVTENRRRSFEVMGFDYGSLFDVWQVHGNNVVCADKPRLTDDSYQKADAILTSEQHVTLFMRFADCVPIFLYDPIEKIIGLVHAGWMGTVNRVSTNAINIMHARYGSKPNNILAAIGPSIGPDHYQIGVDVVTKVWEAFGQDASGLLEIKQGPEQSNTYLNLWDANKLVLEESGVRKVEIASICTACSVEDWYSYRAEKGNTGRFGAIITLSS